MLDLLKHFYQSIRAGLIIEREKREREREREREKDTVIIVNTPC